VKLHAVTLATLADMGFDKMTPVQSACIPLFLGCKDVAAEAVRPLNK
jgi:ATP-dependent RNA helicase DDX55/SPB4